MTTRRDQARGIGRDGRSYDVSFGSGGSAVQAHKVAVARAEKRAQAKAARDSKRGK